jgi:CTP synthase (UTP-ammonia lyase)
MSRAPIIGLIGDKNPAVKAHVAIPKAVSLAAETGRGPVEVAWLQTTSLSEFPDLSAFNGLWCVPGSPYENMAGALGAIRCAREMKIPFLGTCGGFQHALIEYGRNVLGLAEADHAESSPGATLPLIVPLSCSLVGVSGNIRLESGSRAASIYGVREVVEEYHCNFGLNQRFESELTSGGMKISGFDDSGDARVIELGQHPFFMATLFQPELSALNESVHPLVAQFVREVEKHAALMDARPKNACRRN